jgi:hypothetical protein
MLIGAESFASGSKTVVSGDKASATAYATAGSLSLLGGLVKLDGLRADTEADSDGTRGTATGTVSWKSLTLLGQTIALNQDGAASPLGVTTLPPLPASVGSALADLGLSIALPKLTRTASGAAAMATGQGLTVTLDTKVLRGKLNLSALLDPVLNLLPAGLLTQLTPWLNLGPKLVFILGTATSQANATPTAQDAAAPPPAGSTGAGGSAGGGSSATGSTGDTVPAAGGAPVPVADGGSLPAPAGIPWYVYVSGFGLAAAVAYGLRRSMALMFGTGGCDLGAATGVPRLRER